MIVRPIVRPVVRSMVNPVNERLGASWSSYWTPQSLVVENAEPTKVVMTGMSANTSAVASDFTISGFAVTSLARDVTNKILTLTLSTSVLYGDTLVVVWNGINYPVTNNVSINPEITTYISGLTTPLSSDEVIRLNRMVNYWKTGWGCSLLSDCADAIWIYSTETAEAGLKNIVKNAHHCEAVNSPAYVANEGFKSNGISSYLKTNYTPSVDTSKFTLDSAAFAIYCRSTRGTSASKSSGVDNTIGDLRINPYRLASTQAGKVNDTGFITVNTGSDTAKGMTIVVRTASNARRIIKNKTAGAVNGTLSIALTTDEVLIGAYSNSGVPAGFDDVQIAFACLTRGLTEAEAIIFFDGLEAYLDSKGKGVVA